MGMPDVVRRWTREEVLALPDDGKRYELVEGELLVSPSPSWGHQIALAALFRRLDPFLIRNRLGTALLAPADLDLGRGYVVQPDLFVIPEVEVERLDVRFRLPNRPDKADLRVGVVGLPAFDGSRVRIHDPVLAYACPLIRRPLHLPVAPAGRRRQDLHNEGGDPRVGPVEHLLDVDLGDDKEVWLDDVAPAEVEVRRCQ